MFKASRANAEELFTKQLTFMLSVMFVDTMKGHTHWGNTNSLHGLNFTFYIKIQFEQKKTNNTTTTFSPVQKYPKHSRFEAVSHSAIKKRRKK